MASACVGGLQYTCIFTVPAARVPFIPHLYHSYHTCTLHTTRVLHVCVTCRQYTPLQNESVCPGPHVSPHHTCQTTRVCWVTADGAAAAGHVTRAGTAAPLQRSLCRGPARSVAA